MKCPFGRSEFDCDVTSASINRNVTDPLPSAACAWHYERHNTFGGIWPPKKTTLGDIRHRSPLRPPSRISICTSDRPTPYKDIVLITRLTTLRCDIPLSGSHTTQLHAGIRCFKAASILVQHAVGQGTYALSVRIELTGTIMHGQQQPSRVQ